MNMKLAFTWALFVVRLSVAPGCTVIDCVFILKPSNVMLPAPVWTSRWPVVSTPPSETNLYSPVEGTACTSIDLHGAVGPQDHQASLDGVVPVEDRGVHRPRLAAEPVGPVVP